MPAKDLSSDEHRLTALQRIEDAVLTETGNAAEVFVLLDRQGATLMTKRGRSRALQRGGLQHFTLLDREVETVLATLVRARRLTARQAAAAHLHAVWTRFAERHPGEYA